MLVPKKVGYLQGGAKATHWFESVITLTFNKFYYFFFQNFANITLTIDHEKI